MDKEIVDTIEVAQDVGFYEPSWKKVKLNLWSDGSVTWEKA